MIIPWYVYPIALVWIGMLIYWACFLKVTFPKIYVRYRFGKPIGILSSGWNYSLPFIDTFEILDTRVKSSLEIKETVFTKSDGENEIEVEITAEIFYRFANDIQKKKDQPTAPEEILKRALSYIQARETIEKMVQAKARGIFTTSLARVTWKDLSKTKDNFIDMLKARLEILLNEEEDGNNNNGGDRVFNEQMKIARLSEEDLNVNHSLMETAGIFCDPVMVKDIALNEQLRKSLQKTAELKAEAEATTHEAEITRRRAAGEADAILARGEAEAKVIERKGTATAKSREAVMAVREQKGLTASEQQFTEIADAVSDGIKNIFSKK